MCMGINIWIHSQCDCHLFPSLGSEFRQNVNLLYRFNIEASDAGVDSREDFLICLPDSGIINVFRLESTLDGSFYLVAADAVCSKTSGGDETR